MILAAALHLASALRNVDDDVAAELEPRRRRDLQEQDRDRDVDEQLLEED